MRLHIALRRTQKKGVYVFNNPIAKPLIRLEVDGQLRIEPGAMDRAEKNQRAGRLKRQGLTLKIIASRLGVSEGEASKLAKQAADQTVHERPANQRG